MKRIEWIILERKRKWIAAIRAILRREGRPDEKAPALIEVRTLDDASKRLSLAPRALALVEVERRTFGATLDWLARMSDRFAGAQFAALLDYDMRSFEQGRGASGAGGADAIAMALLEAGAAEIVDSPRHLQGIVQLGRRHACRLALEIRSAQPSEMSIIDYAHASLPWQDR